jgi:hypothetical protein
MDPIEALYSSIERGRQGLNIGLNIGLPKLQSMTDGVQRSTYTVIAGGTGSGKSTFALYSYVYRVINDHLGDNRYRVVFFSFEMTTEIILAKLLSMFIWETYQIEAPYKTIMSRQGVISEELYILVNSCKPWLKEVMKQLTIIDHPIGADAVYANMKAYAGRNGRETTGENGRIHYEPTIENEIVQIVIDHLGLTKIGNNRTKKEEMDLLANYLVTIRNIYHYSPLVLMQINRTSSSMDRRKGGFSEIELSDLKDTGTAAEAAEIVLAIFNPWKQKLNKHADYNIKLLQDHYRSIQILKSRLGEADKQVAVNFWGSTGIFEELPPAEELSRLSDQQMQKYTTLVPELEYRPIQAPIDSGKIVFKL